jgi:hypothetical protein
MSKIARYYDASKNPDGGALGGVPLADMTEEQWDALEPHQRASADALPFYRKTKPPATSDGPPTDVPKPAPAEDKPTAPAKPPAADKE